MQGGRGRRTPHCFDSLRWDFLKLVMTKLGFGTKWCSWIFGCLRNARASVLVNGSPTCEFDIQRGLRQSDPLSPFLFILAMEGLHVLTCKANTMGLFKGASIGNGNDSMSISHLMYADDVIFLGEWSSGNVHNLICMLRCFYLISGLKINVNKCNILGIGVSQEEVSDMANTNGCDAATFPLKYLGVPIGCNMARCSYWNDILLKFASKLSPWKARMLSVGGRLSLIKSVLGNLPSYYMSIYMMHVSIQKKLESMRNNFFISGDLDEKKMTLRFLCNSLNLWVRVVKILHGTNGGITEDVKYSSSHSPWNGILSAISRLKLKGIDLLSLCVRKIGNGASLFGAAINLLKPPRGGAELSQLNDLLSLIQDVVLSDSSDSWIWPVDVPSGVNLDRRDIDVGSLLCPICLEDLETVNHIFFSCNMAKDLWSLFANWWEIDIPVCANAMEWFEWLDALAITTKVRSYIEGKLGSPQLLMLSGIEPSEQLTTHVIKVVLDLVRHGLSNNPMSPVLVPMTWPVEISLIEVVEITRFEREWFYISMNEYSLAVEKGEAFIPARIGLSDGELLKIITYRDLAKLSKRELLKITTYWAKLNI
nr:hypothetical protein [Tanacetum cinerariifolium]